MHKDTGYRADIDGLRAFAVIAVLLFHAKFGFASGGFIGVDVFFVISGFLITGIIQRQLSQGKFSLKEFYARRAHRIFPALALVIFSAWLIAWKLFTPIEFRALGKHVVAAALFASNLALWREAGYFDASADSKPLLHLWSLGIEEQFYLVWPLVLILVWRIRMRPELALWALFAASFLANWAIVDSHPVSAFYLPFFRFWELLAGAGLAIGINSHPMQRFVPLSVVASNILSIVGLSLLLLASYFFNSKLSFPGVWALVPVLSAVFLIYAGEKAWVNRIVLAHPICVFIGLISYPLYLWHWPLMVFARFLRPHDVSNFPEWGALGLSFPLAWLTQACLERRTRPFGKGTGKTAAIGAALAGVALIGFFTVAKNGFPKRFSKELGEVANFTFDRTVPWRVGKCFLLAEQNSSAFSSECLDAEVEGKKEIVYLWGDSFAAALSPGLRKVVGKEFRVAQYTASACPPLVGYHMEDRPLCREINIDSIERIKRLRPRVVVLGADWRKFHLKWLEKTVHQLNLMRIPRVVIIGPVPQWEGGLPRVLFSIAQKDPFNRIPDRASEGLITEMFDVDKALAKKYGDGSATYVSPIEVFCNNEGCLTRTSSAPASLTAQDVGHLTKDGSEFLFEKIGLKPFR